MIKYVVALCLFMATAAPKVVADVLIVADEFPAMELLAGKLKAAEQLNGRVVSQKELPVRLDAFEAVVVYIHRELAEKTEDTLIDYANGGGKLVLLHHSISSGKRNNKRWFGFLGVSLPEADLSQGGYKWIEGVSFHLVNLNPNHFIMTNRVDYPIAIQCKHAAVLERGAKRSATPLWIGAGKMEMEDRRWRMRDRRSLPISNLLSPIFRP